MKKVQIIAIFSAVLMFVFGYLFLSSLGGKNVAAAKDQKVENVVVAVKDIPAYTTLTSDMLAVRQAIVGENKNYYTSVNDVVGSVTSSAIYSGEVVTGSRVTKDKGSIGLAGRIENGKRAISVKVDIEQGVANNLKVGNYVDVIYDAEVKDANGGKAAAGALLTGLYGAGQPANSQVMGPNVGQYFSVIALQNVKVISLNNAANDTSSSTASGYTSVTLEVAPADAAKIALMCDNGGKIRLILRAAEDNSIVNEASGSVLKTTR